MTEKFDIAPWLLRSKVTPPRQLTSTIRRPELVRKLNEGMGGGLIILEAPGGYGKSCLLSEWRSALLDSGKTVPWVSADEDDDADTFVAYLAYACHLAGIEMLGSGLLDFEFSSDTNRIQAVFQVLASVERSSKEVVIVIDDFERLTKPVTTGLMPLLLRRLPENATLVIASREAASISTVDYDHRSMVTRIEAQDLRFSRLEIEKLWEKRLSRRHLTRLEASTEGWPVLVRLLLSASDMGTFDIRHIDKTSYADTTITEYFEQKILSRVSDEIRFLLYRVSLFEEVTISLAKDIVFESGQERIFQELQNLEAFIAPLSDEVEGFRLHPMMRSYLRHRFQEMKPLEYSAMERKAALWFSQHGNHVRAVKHAVRTDDRALVADVLNNTGGIALWLREGLIEFRAIDKYLSEDMVLESPIATCMRALIFMKSGRPEDSRRLIDRLAEKQKNGEWRGEDVQMSYLFGKCLLAPYRGELLRREDVSAIKEYIGRQEPTPVEFQAFLHTIECMAAHQSQDFGQARIAAKDAIRTFKQLGSMYGEVYIHLHIAMIMGLEGNKLAANTSFTESGKMIRRNLSYDDGIKTIHDILHFEFEHDRAPMDTNNLARLTNVATSLLKNEGWIDIYSAAYRTLSEKLYFSGRVKEAFHTLETAVSFAEQNNIQHLAEICRAQRLIFRAQAGHPMDVHGDNRFVEDFGRYQPSENVSVHWRLIEAKAEAYLVWALHGTQQIDVEPMVSLRDSFLQRGNMRAASRLSALLAAAAPKDQFDRHAKSLNEILSVDRFTRAVAFAAPKIRQRLGSLMVADEYNALTRCLSDISSSTIARGGHNEDLLSEKERAVLTELSRGLTDKEIGLQIGITEHTVRYHLKKIYAKLNAHNRLDAVQRAERLGILVEEADS